jgi:SAM-dependent MidA family methyltransferase
MVHMVYLTQRIYESIDLNGGRVTFYDYMNFCLYGPKDGFYNNTELKFIKDGGVFFTIPEYSKFFAYFVALKLNVFYRKNVNVGLLEVGAGTGRFLLDVLTFLCGFGTVIGTIIIVEYSYYLRQQQYSMFKNTYFFNNITWVCKIPYGYTGIILCNEIIDAIPVHCYISYYNNFYYQHL